MNDLEMAILSAIARHGPRSAYSVREEFRRSFVSTWSSSTGSIYPAVKRLLAKNFLAASAPGDGRGTRLLEATPAGLDAVKKWIGSIIDLPKGAPFDPIRTRLQNIALLGLPEMLKLIDRSIEISQDLLSSMLAELRQGIILDRFEYMATSATAMQIEARLRWLDAMRSVIVDQPEEAEFFARMQRLLEGRISATGKV